MIDKASPEELFRIVRIRDSGIPMDQTIIENLQASCRGLSICQTGSVLETMIFDLEHGGCGYMLSIAVHNDSDKILRVEQYRLNLPWPESHFHWLEDPRKFTPRESWYSFPPHGPEGLSRESVLNHRIGRNGRLLPDDCIEGLLCGVGEASIPDEYHHRQRLLMRLSVFDGSGHRTQIDLGCMVNRPCSAQSRQKAVKKWPSSRRGLTFGNFR